jgi:hypothetical protein
VGEIDFTTALGRLLTDAALREAFSADPVAVAGSLEVAAADRAALAQLSPLELEVHARILLRKRLDIVRARIPQTCARLGDRTWERFCAYARTRRPSESTAGLEDTPGFVEYVLRQEPGALCKAEFHRVRFVYGYRRLSVHLATDLVVRGRARWAVQLFLRNRRGTWREWALYFVTLKRGAPAARKS